MLNFENISSIYFQSSSPVKETLITEQGRKIELVRSAGTEPEQEQDEKTDV